MAIIDALDEKIKIMPIKDKKYCFDEKAANDAVTFIEKYLTHTKGELAKAVDFAKLPKKKKL